jgi:hypothetical protein
VRNSTLYLTGAAIHLSLESLAFAAAPGGPAQSREAALDLEDVGLEGGVVAPSTPDAAPSLHGIISFHLADGVGLGGQLRAGSRSLRASVAYVPQHFIIDDDPQDDKFARFKLANTGQLNVDAIQYFGESERGVSLSYRYSTLLGHGVGLAYQSHLEIGGQYFALSVPVIYYPAGLERVQREFGVESGAHINFPFGPRIDYGIGVAWLF